MSKMVRIKRRLYLLIVDLRIRGFRGELEELIKEFRLLKC